MLLILAAYYELKTAREVFILAQGGAEVKNYASAGQAVLLCVLVPAYGALASKDGLIAHHLGDALLRLQPPALALRHELGTPYLGLSSSLDRLLHVMVIAQFWSFANDHFTPEQGKRLFAIGVGSSLGAGVRIDARGDSAPTRPLTSPPLSRCCVSAPTARCGLGLAKVA